MLRPLAARERAGQPNDDRRDLLISIHSLWRLDLGFCLTNIKDDEYDPLVRSSLKPLLPPRDEGIQNSSLRTFGAILSRVESPMDEYADYVTKFLYYARYAIFCCITIVY